MTWVPTERELGDRRRGARSLPQQAFAIELASLTRALDPTRPVISNDGWEHVDSDIIGIHDYTARTWRLACYGGTAGRRTTVEPHAAIATVPRKAPSLRRPTSSGNASRRSDVPVMLTEFGGVKYAER